MIRNTSTFTIALEIVSPKIPNLELRYLPTTLSPGMRRTVSVLVNTVIVGERVGSITIRATNCNGKILALLFSLTRLAVVECPFYINVVHPATGAKAETYPAPRTLRLSPHAMEHCRATPDEFSRTTIQEGMSLLKTQGLDTLEKSSRPQSALSRAYVKLLVSAVSYSTIAGVSKVHCHSSAVNRMRTIHVCF